MTGGEGRMSSTEASAEEPLVDVLAPAGMQQVLQDGETVILALRPSPWFILIDGSWVYFASIFVALLLAWLAHQPWSPVILPESQIFPLLATVLSIRIVWKFLDWANRVYVLTDQRIMRRRGVIQYSLIEAPLDRIQHSAIFTRVVERVLGLGTIGFATAGSGRFEVIWEMIANPIEIHRKVNDAIDRYGRRGDHGL
ncbi:MAG: PH domain-containing protein [Planctomycetota bacterium]|nr:PH domain-containing protein [Planctomycetota bacterium]MEC8735266.1 PH domain-containing protein [Planctomycetota bacterium]MEC9232843.1 PH domain-containing protein [Planctomycetota bacterium]